MALSIAQYTKNKNIRQSLAYSPSKDKYYYKGVWVDKQELDEVLPIDLPFAENRRKGDNPEVSKRFVHNQKSYL